VVGVEAIVVVGAEGMKEILTLVNEGFDTI
jgi:hypothetical protein